MLSPEHSSQVAAPPVLGRLDRPPVPLTRESVPPVEKNVKVSRGEPAAVPPRPRRVPPKAICIMDPTTVDVVYGPEEFEDLRGLVDIYAAPQSRESIRENLSVMQDAEMIVSSWGAPRLDETFLTAAPNLRAVFHGAGSVRPFTTPASWQRGIIVTSAAEANAAPVAEYTLATILLALKRFWHFAGEVRRGAGWGDHTRWAPGAYRTTVGLVSCGVIARKVLARLAACDVKCLVYDPFMGECDAGGLGVELCTLPELFQRSDVVSVHTPELPETLGFITGELLASMKHGATFINTARGPLVREEELVAVMRERPDLQAILDVCNPEPPLPDTALLTLPNVVLTPHIAGSMGLECRRLGRFIVDEVRRYVAGEPLRGQVNEEQVSRMA